MRIFHLATADDWAAAQRAGRYTTATRGRSLAEEGFIHASRGDQWQQARQRWFADVAEPLVLLVVETELLSVPVIEEPAPGGRETFPHVYGAIDLAAVVQVVALAPLGSAAPTPSSRTPAATRPPTAPPEGPATAVVSAARPVAASFSRVYLRVVFHHLALACVVLAVVVAGSLLGLALLPGWGPLVGAVVGLGAGLVLSRALNRRAAR